MWTQQVVFFKEMGEQGQDTRCWEEYGRRGCANSITSQSGLMPAPQQCLKL
jgi:hypothetical protein